ncbi:MAG: 1-deoxy-D-xylulose-5-phosphate reductoisomerase [Alphaproteobacteria bacterium]
MSRTLNILGVTGSIGQGAVDVVLSDRARFEVKVVSAHENVERLADLAVQLRARKAVITNPENLFALKEKLRGTGIACETDLISAMAEKTDVTLVAIVGMAALCPALKAAEISKVLALASKEPVAAAGALLMETARKRGTKILPVDSEHNAIFQVSHTEDPASIEKIILTASGGPFRTWSAEKIKMATPEQALAHPNWSMGAKISIDSATMMNKALEIIEAHYLFSMQPEKIEVMIHPQSVVHSMVEYRDGSVLAQMGASDMRTPISYALAWPERMQTPGRRLDFNMLKSLDFEKPDTGRFPALRLAYECLARGPSHCIALNAANEVAVDAFLCKRIGFADIIRTVEFVLGETPLEKPSDLHQIEQIDAKARAQAGIMINSMSTNKSMAV